MSFRSKIILAKNIKLDRDYNNVLSYSENDMLTLVNANKIAVADDYSFIRPTKNRISTHFLYDTVLQCNYIAFQNKDYSNKWFFAWIDEVIFKNEGTTEIVFTVDEWSTWFDYWTKKACFVVREHVNNDTIGLHTVPENLSVEEVKAESVDEYTSFSDCYIAILSTYNLSDAKLQDGSSWVSVSSFPGPGVYNGQVFGDTIFLFDSIVEFRMFIENINTEAHTGDISAVCMIPKNIFTANDLNKYRSYYEISPGTSTPFYYYKPKNSTSIYTGSKTIHKTTSFTGVTIKNNKCYTYPYNYLYVTNNVGNDNIFKYEDFSTSNVVFDLEFSVSVGCSGRFVPKNYKGVTSNYTESIIVPKFPTCSWSSDAFTNWLTQNAVNIPTQISNIGVNTASAIGSVATGNVAGGIMGLVSTSNSIAGLVGQFYQASLLPAIKQGSNNADINYTASKNKIQFYHMRAKNEYITIIDDYFSRYGYKVNTTKQPNITGRTYWNYVEIAPTEEIGYGEVPSISMQTINNACRKGVTIWHDHSNLGNYSLTNSIVT